MNATAWAWLVLLFPLLGSIVIALGFKALPAKAGMTATLVRSFLKKFKERGFIEYIGDGPLTINDTLLSVVLHD